MDPWHVFVIVLWAPKSLTAAGMVQMDLKTRLAIVNLSLLGLREYRNLSPNGTNSTLKLNQANLPKQATYFISGTLG